MRKTFRAAAALLVALALVLSLAGCSGSDGKLHLTFQIWDVAQRDGMQAMCDAYTANVNPNVEIDVQVTSWGEYWTKLEAAAESNTTPDIFWMHTDQILYYSDFGMLADVTDLYQSEDPNYYQNHFSDISISNAQGSDGRLYGIPKDKDNVCMVYNREMFDAAGVAYPDESWTWDDLVDASQKIYDATGKYGYMAYNDEQLGYHNFVYQAGGQILTDDKTQGGFDRQATRDAVKFYVDLQKNDWCPDQAYFAETSPGTAFFSEIGAIFLEGSWNLISEMQNYPNMMGKWDVAPLPACPDPVSGDGRATISNGLTYATAAHGKNLDAALDVLKYFGTEEAQRIQGESGAAIPAYEGLGDSWISAFDQFEYSLDLRQTYMGIPTEIGEAAYLDGCNQWQTFYKVMFPLTGTSVAALTIFTAVFAYGDLMWPLVVNSDLQMMTLSSGLATLRGQFSTNFPVLMAGSLLAMLPMVILYMIFQRQFIEGIANTGGK